MISRESDEKSDFDVDKVDTTLKNENTLDMDFILFEEVFCSDHLYDFIDDVLVNSDEPRDENDLRPDVDSRFEYFLEWSINFDEGSKESKDPEVIDETFLDVKGFFIPDPDELEGASAGHDISDDVSEQDTSSNFFDWEVSEKVFEVIDVITVDENTEDEKNSDDDFQYVFDSENFEADDKCSDNDSKACFDSEAFDDVLGDTCSDNDSTEYDKNFDDDPKAVFSSDDHVADDGVDSKAGITADDFDDFFVDAKSVDDRSFDDFTDSDDGLRYILIFDSFDDVIVDDFTECDKNSDDDLLDTFISDIFEHVGDAFVDDENSDDNSKGGFIPDAFDDEAMDISIDDLSTCDKNSDDEPLDDFISDAFEDVVSSVDLIEYDDDDDSKAGFFSDGFVDNSAVDTSVDDFTE